jgi:MFS family permease
LKESAIDTDVSLRQEIGVIAAVGAGTFTFALQVTAVLVALPSISLFLGPAISAGWVATSYLLFLTGFLLVFGRLGDLLGNRRTYVAGLVLYTLASLVCAAAHLPNVLLAARSFQGVGAALASANSPALLTRHLSPRRRGRALGCQATMTYLGLTLGPICAATLIAHSGWHAIFLVEVPAGILATLLALVALPADSEEEDRFSAIPLGGAFLWLACLAPFVFALGQGQQWGWHSPGIIGLFAASTLAVVVFVSTEIRSRNPLIPVQLFRNVDVGRSILCETLLYGGMYSISFVLPIMATRGLGLGTAMAGTLLMSQALTRLFVTPLAGFLSDWFGPARLIAAGSFLFATGALLLLLFWRHASPALLLALVAFTGLGPSLFVPANSARLFASVSFTSHGVAAGMLATARNLGMLLGTAGAAACCAGLLRQHHSGEMLATGVRNVYCLVLAASIAMLITDTAPWLQIIYRRFISSSSNTVAVLND